MKSKTVVLYSGGLDSTVVLAQELHAGNEVLALTIDYDQSNASEIGVCHVLARYWGFQHKVIDVQLERRDARCEIPARNTIFLAKALEFALIHGADKIAYGAEPDATYTDSSVAYIDAMRAVTALHGVELTAPIRHYSGKLEVLYKALDLGVPLDLVHSSRTNRVDSACSASARFLVTLHKLFPNVHPIDLLSYIRDSHVPAANNGYNLVSPPCKSFKFLPAFMLLATRGCLAPDVCKDPLTVYTTGNWGAAVTAANEILRIVPSVEVVKTDSVEELGKNMLNTDHPAAQWGIKQALSRLPRPMFMRAGLKFRVTQGHLRKAVLGLGYIEDQAGGLPLITEL